VKNLTPRRDNNQKRPRLLHPSVSAKLSFVQTVLTDSPEHAAEFIRHGGVVAFPTETVYGLGADVFDESAIQKIFEAKQRPADNPLIAHVGNLVQIGELAADTSLAARKLIESFFPGPLTIVLPKTARVPRVATAGLETIGVRMPGNETARRFLSACGVPVVAPSANLSGRPSPTTWMAVLEDLDGRIDCILQGDQAEVGIESTVVDCTDDVPVVLRKGAVSIEQLREVVPEIVCLSAGDIATAAKSPGLKHKHYSPRAAVKLVEPGSVHVTSTDAYIGMREPNGEPGFQRVCASLQEYAHSLFEFFRESDRRGMTRIVCEAVEEEGIGAALMDRIRRAASTSP
jgi:L-threonylcarbamoyladenylate synthase